MGGSGGSDRPDEHARNDYRKIRNASVKIHSEVPQLKRSADWKWRVADHTTANRRKQPPGFPKAPTQFPIPFRLRRTMLRPPHALTKSVEPGWACD